MDKVLTIAGQRIHPGETRIIELKMAKLYDSTDLSIPVKVIRGLYPGPTLFISAAIHGDELNGVEIVRRLSRHREIRNIRGTLILVPVVNIFGFNNKSRYLPDRRDLNRSFPGNSKGSLASRIAHTFMKEIVSKCTHGIDLHTGAIHRNNLPQIRADIIDEETLGFASSFGSKVVLNSDYRDGSLREAARKKKVKMLLFEGGEALRFEKDIINLGIKGCLKAMIHIGMLPVKKKKKKQSSPNFILANDSYWLRSPQSGTIRLSVSLGDIVEAGDTVGKLSDLLGEDMLPVTARYGGIIIGINHMPLVTQGEAILHIATLDYVQHNKAFEDGSLNELFT